MHNKILLTGAGFTRNFGGSLSEDMATEIFNELDKKEDNALVKILRNEGFDYESAYQAIVSDSAFTDEEKEKINVIMKAVYKNLDDKICNEIITHSTTISSFQSELLNKLIPEGDMGYFFTLNQDLFIERNRGRITDVTYYRPAANIMVKHGWAEFNDELYCIIDDDGWIKKKEEYEKKLSKIKSGSDNGKNIAYIKLHGSMDWLIKAEGESLMVIGGDKKKHIEKYPLLSWYYDIFERVINKNNTKLLIIGYGFNDPHINEVLNKAICNYNLELFVICPTHQGEFEGNLKLKKCGEKILKGLTKYYPCTLADLFPNNSQANESIVWQAIREEFFGS